MSARERSRLVARIRQMRNATMETVSAAPPTGPVPSPLAALEVRVAHLEELLQGFQDSVYREAQRESRRLTELEARIEPAALAAELSKHARERGL